jgi:hypothetical protein
MKLKAAVLRRLFPDACFAVALITLACFASGTVQAATEAEEEIIIVEDAPDSGGPDTLVTEGLGTDTDDVIAIETKRGDDEVTAGEIVIEPAGSAEEGTPEGEPDDSGLAGKDIDLSLERVWLEYGHLTRSSQSVDGQAYGHFTATLEWQPEGPWEVRLSGRLDGYFQHGEPNFNKIAADYGESFVRWRGEEMRVTAGTQTILWGRIDELPPMDRLSRVDASRGILDELPDRRRALPALRAEVFFEGAKLDAAWIPWFRPAQLAPRESIWYPIDQARGTVLGLETNPLTEALIRTARIDDDGPGGDGGFGLRYTKTGTSLDFGLTVQNNRQSTPYFRYDAATRSLVAEHPRSCVLGGDFALQTAGATWRAEAVYLDKVPVTRTDGTYDTTEGISWGAGVEFFPGDGDTRVNLQFAANHLLNTPDVLDRTETYNLNGAVETLFGHGRWRAGTRFFFGLDERDIYINPELAFLGWEPHELYLEAHYFEGETETLGGFYQDNTLVALGWRARF